LQAFNDPDVSTNIFRTFFQHYIFYEAAAMQESVYLVDEHSCLMNFNFYSVVVYRITIVDPQVKFNNINYNFSMTCAQWLIRLSH
jgi:hypothetical protein